MSEAGTSAESPTPDGEILHGFVWRPGETLAEADDAAAIQAAYADPDSRLWIDLEEATERTLGSLAECLGLHHLTVEDIVERNQRAKVEYTEGTMHLVLFALAYDGEVVPIELDIVLGARFLLTSHTASWRPLDAPNIRRNGVAHYLAAGPDHMLWAVADAAVDGYFPVFDRLGDEIDQLQADVLGRPSSWVVERLFGVRRDLLTIRHAINPEREVFNQLTNRENPLIDPARVIYFRDVYDHLIRLSDESDSYRELVATTLDAYLSTVNNNLSEVMKRLTAVTVILAGVGAVAGIFGMSEAGLALEFAEAPGFWIITGLVVALGAGGLLYFRRIGWI
jgi:magnesium transporter